MSGSKLPLLIVFITVFIDLLGFGIVLPLLPRYGKIYHATPFELGLLISSFSAMQFLFAPLWGRISDRIGRRPIILLGLLGSTLSYALFSYVSHFGDNVQWLGMSILGWLFISRITAGIAGATIPTAQAYIADSTEIKDRGKGMALIGVAFGIGFVFGPMIGAISLKMNDGPDWRPGAAAAILSGLAFLFAFLKLPESIRPGAQPIQRNKLRMSGLTRILSRADLTMLLATMFLTTMAFAQLESTLSLLTESIGLDKRSNYFAFAYLGMVLLIAQGYLVRKLLPRWGEQRMATVGAALMGIGLPLVAIVNWGNSNPSPIDASAALVSGGTSGSAHALWMLWATLPWSVIGFAALNPSLQASLSLRTSEQQQGEVLGFGQSASALARIVGPLTGNYLFGISPSYPYLVGGALMALGLLCVWITGRSGSRVQTGTPHPVSAEIG